MSKKTGTKYLPLIILIGALAVAWATGSFQYLSLDSLKDNYANWHNYVAEHPLLASLIYAAIYIIVVALSVPGGTALTLAGGALFGGIWGASLTVLSATIGATIIFLAARTAFGDTLRKKTGSWIEKMQKGFAEDEWSYMFALRFLPIVPFFIVNLAPAFLGVRLVVFVTATFFGIMPATFVYSTLGAGISDLIAAGADIQLADLRSPKLIGSLVALGIIALLPAIYKKVKAKRVKS